MRALSLIVIVAALAGCSPYVNVPGRPAALSYDNVNDPNVRDAIASAVQHQLTHYPPAKDWAFRLPQGATDRTYESVVKLIGRGQRYTGQTDVVVYDILSIELHAADGRVDLVPPINQTGGVARVRSIYLSRRPDEWIAVYDKTWQLTVPEAMHLANPSAGELFADYQPINP